LALTELKKHWLPCETNWIVFEPALTWRLIATTIALITINSLFRAIQCLKAVCTCLLFGPPLGPSCLPPVPVGKLTLLKSFAQFGSWNSSPAAAPSKKVSPDKLNRAIRPNLSFQVGGKLVSRLVDVGDRVKKGQVLAKLDPQDLGLALQAAQAQYDAAATEHTQLKTDLDRAKTLKLQNFISQAELDRRQLALDAAASRLSQARAQLSTQSNQRQYGDLRAPNDGVISAVYAEAGQVMAPGQAVVQYANENEVQVSMAVPESRVADIQLGQAASVLLWSGKESLNAKVREVSPVADPVTRTFAVLLDVTDPGKSTRFGMSATVQFSKAAQSNAFKLPISALVAEHTGAFVWVFDETRVWSINALCNHMTCQKVISWSKMV
jgi:RND family efflux transporter MFP subunit